MHSTPAAVRNWLEAHACQDVDQQMTSLAEDVVVAAGGRIFCGRAAAREWSMSSARERHQVLSMRLVNRVDATIVTLRLQGGVSARRSEVSYCFLHKGDLIRGLVVGG
jgi:ketosteroid isomerase-like protein